MRRIASGLTPLMQAAYEGHLGVAELLVDKGADVNAKDKVGWTALTCAACEGHLEVVKLLKDRVAGVTLTDAACLGDVRLVERLTQRRCRRQCRSRR